MMRSTMSEKAFSFTIDSLLRCPAGTGRISECSTAGATQGNVAIGLPSSQSNLTSSRDQSSPGSSCSSVCTNVSRKSDFDISTSSDFTHTTKTADGDKQLAKKSKKCFTEFQTGRLEERFKIDKYLSSDQRVDLAEQLGLTNQQVTRWFQNRRMKEKRQLIQLRASQSSLCPQLGGHVRTQLPALGVFVPPSAHHLQLRPTYFPYVRNAPFSMNPVQLSHSPFPRSCCHQTFFYPCSCSL